MKFAVLGTNEMTLDMAEIIQDSNHEVVCLVSLDKGAPEGWIIMDIGPLSTEIFCKTVGNSRYLIHICNANALFYYIHYVESRYQLNYLFLEHCLQLLKLSKAELRLNHDQNLR